MIIITIVMRIKLIKVTGLMIEFIVIIFPVTMTILMFTEITMIRGITGKTVMKSQGATYTGIPMIILLKYTSCQQIPVISDLFIKSILTMLSESGGKPTAGLSLNMFHLFPMQILLFPLRIT